MKTTGDLIAMLERLPRNTKIVRAVGHGRVEPVEEIRFVRGNMARPAHGRNNDFVLMTKEHNPQDVLILWNKGEGII